MKRTIPLSLLCGALLASAQCLVAAEEQAPAANAPAAREESVLVTITEALAISLEKTSRPIKTEAQKPRK